MGGIGSGIGGALNKYLGKTGTTIFAAPFSKQKSFGAKVQNLSMDPLSLFGGGPLQKEPKAEPVTPMPDIDALGAAKRRSVAQQRARGGRASTILSDGSNETLG